MKSIKFIRAMIFMLTVSCLLVALMGCGGAEKTNGGTSESTSASESSEITANTVSSESASASESSEIKEEDMSEKEDLIEKMKKDFRGVPVNFTAELFAQRITLNREITFNVQVVKNEIYLDYFVYELVEVVDEFPMYYDINDFRLDDKSVSNKKYSDIMQKIMSAEKYYILESDENVNVGKRVVVCQVDGNYYFLTYLNNSDEMIRVNYVRLNEESLYDPDSETTETETQEITTEEETAVKENPEKSPELNALFETLQKDDEQSEKMKFSISYQDLHYELKESEKYDNEKWRNYSISLCISCNYDLAVEEEWYKACQDTEIETLNIALFNEYKAELSDGHFSSYGFMPALYFTYSYSEETMIETLALFYSDYEVLKRLLDFEYVTRITVTYYYSVPGSFFDD